VTAKKHTECLNAGVSDGKDQSFDASRFDRCRKNYQDGNSKGVATMHAIARNISIR
jgi:hypothetical protein